MRLYSSYIFLFPLVFSLSIAEAQAQIIPDVSLPINSLVTPNGNTNLISGGTRTGSNLFHSFTQFSLPTGSKAFFNNPTDIQNIFTRVTGSSISNIDGIIKANGTANLFLINPNGITFGANAKLNINGSFIGTTASSIKFNDGTEFSTTNPTSPGVLLTINVPIGLQFGINPGQIIVQGPGNNLHYMPPTEIIDRNNRNVGLQVPSGQTLALVGGDISLIGGNLTAETGRIELGSVGSGSYVTLTPINSGWQLGYSGVQNFQNISFSAAASADVSGIGGGNIQIQAKNFSLADTSAIITDTTGNNQGGNLTVHATDTVQIGGIAQNEFVPSGLFSDVLPNATGNGTNITIDTQNLILNEGGRITANTFGIGNSGSINVQANDIQVIGNPLNGMIASGFFADSKAGSSGKGGNLTIETANLTISNGGRIGTSSSDVGDGGNVIINATNAVELIGQSADGTIPSTLFTGNTGGTGKAGNLTIKTPDITIQNGATIDAGTFGAGNGGDLTIQATDQVEVIGISMSGRPSSLAIQTQQGTGKAGNLMIDTPSLTVKDGGVITTSTLGAGDAGNLTILATDQVDVSGTIINGSSKGGLSSNAFQGVGNGGNITITTGKLTVNNGATINVSTFDLSNRFVSGRGAAGNLQIQANYIFLDHNSLLNAATTAGNRSNINLLSQNILLRHGSLITTDAAVNANGGNITINTDTLALLENSNITANAIKGRGGNIFINTQGNFLAPNSEITASSEFGVNGDIKINSPDTDTVKGLFALSTQVVDISRLISRSCSNRTQDKFYITGKGGLGSSPLESLTSSTGIADLGAEIPHRKVGLINVPSMLGKSQFPILEATNWVINEQGKTILVTNTANLEYSNFWLKPNECNLTTDHHLTEKL